MRVSEVEIGEFYWLKYRIGAVRAVQWCMPRPSWVVLKKVCVVGRDGPGRFLVEEKIYRAIPGVGDWPPYPGWVPVVVEYSVTASQLERKWDGKA